MNNMSEIRVGMKGISALPDSYYPDKRLIELMTFIGDSINFKDEEGQGKFEEDCFGYVFYINDRKQMQRKTLIN